MCRLPNFPIVGSMEVFFFPSFTNNSPCVLLLMLIPKKSISCHEFMEIVHSTCLKEESLKTECRSSYSVLTDELQKQQLPPASSRNINSGVIGVRRTKTLPSRSHCVGILLLSQPTAAPVFTCVVTLPPPPTHLHPLQRMGQRGGVSEEAAQAPQSAGPLLLLPFRLLRHPPVLWGESLTHTLDTT